jgi:hypothetical protein
VGKIDADSGCLILNNKYLAYLDYNNVNILKRILHIESKLNIPPDKSVSRNGLRGENDDLKADANGAADGSMIFLSPEDVPSFALWDGENRPFVHIGSSRLLERLAKQAGLHRLARKIFPQLADDLLALAYYLASERGPVDYCEDWVRQNVENLQKDRLSPGDVRELLEEVSEWKTSEFFERWARIRSEDEYLVMVEALGSSYAAFVGNESGEENFEKDEWIRRDFHLVTGRESFVPVRPVSRFGMFNDANRLKSELENFSFLKRKKFTIVADEGFYNEKNIESMLKMGPKRRFLVSPPLNEYHTDLFSKLASDIEKDKYSVLWGRNIAHGKRVKYKWNKNTSVYLYFYFNEHGYYKKDHRIYAQLLKQLTDFEKDASARFEDLEYEKFYTVSQKKNSGKAPGRAVEVNHGAVKKNLGNFGKLILIGNDRDLSAAEALEIFKAKNVLDKGFETFASCVKTERKTPGFFHSHPGGEFICFLAQILDSYLNFKMRSSRSRVETTPRKLLLSFNARPTPAIGGAKISDSLTERQKEVLELFGLEKPRSDKEPPG